jgi:hypothetical protein
MPKQLQLENARFFRAAQRTASANLIDHSVTVACPPSNVLAGIVRYFELRGNILDLVVVDKKRSSPLVAESHVAVEYEPQPNRLPVGRHYDRMELTWRTPHVTQPTFRGRLTIRPSGTKTVLVLKGFSEPPLDFAHATGRFLLQELKAMLEKEFEILREQQPPDKR